MAKKDTRTKDSLPEDDLVPVGPEASDEPEAVDEDHARQIKVSARMDREVRRRPAERTVEDVDTDDLRATPVDVDHEHSLIAEEIATVPVNLQGTTHDGLEGPSHREGEVWESMAPEDDAIGGGRRRVRVQAVEGGEVTAVNLVTGTVSHIKAENLTEPHWRRAHS